MKLPLGAPPLYQIIVKAGSSWISSGWASSPARRAEVFDRHGGNSRFWSRNYIRGHPRCRGTG